MAVELTNTEFAAHMRVMADMLDSPENAWSKILPGILRTLRKGAGIIEALTAENTAKDAEIERISKVNEVAFANSLKWANMYRALQADLARVTAERDAAVKDIRNCCEFCKHYRPLASNHPELKCAAGGYEPSCCMECSKWEWRGPKEGD